MNAVMRASNEVHAHKKGFSDVVPNASAVVQAPVNGSQEEILEASRVMLGGIGGNEVEKSNSSGCYTHSVRILDPFNDRLLGEKSQESVMEGIEAPLLDLNYPVTGVDKGQHRKENKRKRPLKQSMQVSKYYWYHHMG